MTHTFWQLQFFSLTLMAPAGPESPGLPPSGWRQPKANISGSTIQYREPPRWSNSQPSTQQQTIQAGISSHPPLTGRKQSSPESPWIPPSSSRGSRTGPPPNSRRQPITHNFRQLMPLHLVAVVSQVGISLFQWHYRDRIESTLEQSGWRVDQEKSSLSLRLVLKGIRY